MLAPPLSPHLTMSSRFSIYLSDQHQNLEKCYMLNAGAYPFERVIRNVNIHGIEQLEQSLNSKTLKIMTSYINDYANVPWVWPVAQRFEQQPRQLKMWGSIPCHTYNFFTSSAIGVRTTIQHIFLQKSLRQQWVMSSCVVLILLRIQGRERLV